MGLGHQGDVPDLLAGLHALHVHDGDGAFHHIVVSVQGQVKAGDLPAAVADAANDGVPLLLIDGDMVVGHLEHVDLRVVI